MSIPFSSSILYALAIALLVLITYILFYYQRSQSIRYYAGFLFGLSIIAVAQATLQLEGSNLLQVTRLGYLGGIITFSMLLMFSILFPVPTKTSLHQPNLLWIVPVTFFTPLIFFADSFISNVTRNKGEVLEAHGSLFLLFPIVVIFYVCWTIVNLVAKRGLTQGVSRPVGMFLWALLSATTLGLIFDVLLPAAGYSRVGIGIYSAIVLFGLSTYIVVKR